jgi:formylmethanofuran dehydrogenase subunit B
MSTHVVPDVTCLGCGLLCDDVSLALADGRIAGMAPHCDVGRAWFGDGQVPARILVAGMPASFDAALAESATVLRAAEGRALVVLGPGLATSAVRAGIAIADRLGAAVDTATSAGAAEGILAGQRRGRASSTLGEVKNRADLVLFWGVDPATTHPRFMERLVSANGTHVTGERTLLSVHIGEAGGPTAPVLRLDGADEAATLAVLRGIVLGRLAPPPEHAGLSALAAQLVAARYVAIIAPGEGRHAHRAALRAEGLTALAQALNGPTRCTLVTLRDGGNRNGVESALSWQAGYPFAVSFAGGAPAYDPGARGLHELWRADAALVLGDWRALDDSSLAALAEVPTVVAGPRASEAPFAPRVAIDTGIAGIHEGGVAYRLDDVPLPLTPVLDGARTAAMTITALADALGPRGGGGMR